MTNRFGNRTSTAERAGRYNYQHQRARAAAAARHDPNTPCVRCQQPLGPMGPWLHYDHDDDGTNYLGFAHARCNIRAGAIRGNQAQAAARAGHQHTPEPRRRTRTW